MKFSYLWALIVLLVVFFSCASDNDVHMEPEEISPVVMDLNSVPYPKLSDYNFFKSPLSDLNPVYGVLPYEPISSLFTDYASKKRFVWMPDGVSASYDSDGTTLIFEKGTVLIKNFYYENVQPNSSQQLLETRLMIKTESEWIFANYVWNDSQTEAFFDMDGSFVPVTWIQNGVTKEVNYRIPNGAECLSCHNVTEVPLPIGTKPQNLNKSLTYSDGTFNQLQKLKDFGYLSSFPNQIQSVVNYQDNSQPLELRVRSYVDINCAHCHSEQGFCNYRAPRFGYSQTTLAEHLGICVVPDEDITPWANGGQPTHIIKPGSHAESAIYYRLNTTLENIRMPLRGRTIIHEEAVDMIAQWIDTLEGNCE